MAADALSVVAVSPLDSTQVSKASTALLKHISSSRSNKTVAASKRSLLADEDAHSDSDAPDDDTPIWLILTTKRHIADKQRLKPGKVAVPHPLLAGTTQQRVLLITAEPQRAYKDLVAHPSFPAALRGQVARVIDVGKLKAKYRSYEAKRQLAAEHDVVLADDRVTPFLPGILGKAFFRSGAKRPIPVCLTGKEKHQKLSEGKRRPKDTPRLVGQPKDVARDIEQAMHSALVHLSPSTTTAIKIGYASWSPQMLAENIDALVPAVVEKFVPKKWSNVKSIHIKGPETAALPIYMSEELWVDEEEDVRDDAYVEPEKETKNLKGRKRLLLEGGNKNGDASHDQKGKDVLKSSKKEKKRKADDAEDDFEKEISARKAKLKKQKAEAMSKGRGEL